MIFPKKKKQIIFMKDSKFNGVSNFAISWCSLDSESQNFNPCQIVPRHRGTIPWNLRQSDFMTGQYLMYFCVLIGRWQRIEALGVEIHYPEWRLLLRLLRLLRLYFTLFWKKIAKKIISKLVAPQYNDNYTIVI